MLGELLLTLAVFSGILTTTVLSHLNKKNNKILSHQFLDKWSSDKINNIQENNNICTNQLTSLYSELLLLLKGWKHQRNGSELLDRIQLITEELTHNNPKAQNIIEDQPSLKKLKDSSQVDAYLLQILYVLKSLSTVENFAVFLCFEAQNILLPSHLIQVKDQLIDQIQSSNSSVVIAIIEKLFGKHDIRAKGDEIFLRKIFSLQAATIEQKRRVAMKSLFILEDENTPFLISQITSQQPANHDECGDFMLRVKRLNDIRIMTL